MERHRLLTRLEPAKSRRLTVLVAPAGYGKTTLLAEWAARSELQIAWLSIDRGDNDLRRFMRHVIAAIQELHPTVGRGSLPSLRSPEFSDATPLLTSLLSELATIDEPFTFILEDVHFIEEPRVHEAISFLINHLPDDIHFLVSGRSAPPVTLAKMRVRDEVEEITASDLLFSPDEAHRFFSETMDLELSDKQVMTLHSRSEGWVAGMQLAGLSVQRAEGRDALIEGFRGDNRFVVDYLTDEVLASQSSTTQRFMLATSILDKFCAPLCEAVTGERGAQQVLETLERSNLFVVPLDQQRLWYRYHHLFEAVLRRRLEKNPSIPFAKLHQRAATWFERRGFLVEGLHHACASHNGDFVASFLTKHGPTLFIQGEQAAVLAAIEAIPRETCSKNLKLLILTAWSLLAARRRDELEAHLVEAEGALSKGVLKAALSPVRAVLRAELALVRGNLALNDGNYSEAKELALGARKRCSRRSRAIANLQIGLAERWLGSFAAAARGLEQARDQAAEDDSPMVGLPARAALSRLQLARGQWMAAFETATESVQLAEQRGCMGPVLGLNWLVLYELHYERDELDAAGRALAKARAFIQGSPVPESRLRVLEAILEFAQRQTGGTRAVEPSAQVSTPRWLTGAERFIPVVPPLPVYQARLCLMERQPDRVLAWLAERNLTPDDPVRPELGHHYLLMARALVAKGDVHLALPLLTNLFLAAESVGWLRMVMEVLAVQSLARHTRGEARQAIATLERALELAEPQGLIRPFLDLGPSMSSLLKKTQRSSTKRAFVELLLNRFGEIDPLACEGLLEPLSDREFEVLSLLVSGLSNREISKRLFVSINTIKTHISRVYGKLGVNSRSKAIARCKELHLIAGAK
ncbi:MAG: LuxR C-terminal-related transcriptional regulator [Myxococcota bacterium]